MKKCILTIACLALATSIFAARHPSQERYNGRATHTTEASSTDSVSARHKELTLKREWTDMEEELRKSEDFGKI